MHRSPREKAEEKKRGGSLLKKYPPYGKGESFGIPYRQMPRNLKNMLVVGRSISCTQPLQGSTRIMPACLATGQAAGTAAAMAAESGSGDVHCLDVDLLWQRLRNDGAWFC